MNVDRVIQLHRVVDKMGMMVKQRMIDNELNPEESRDSLIKRVNDAVGVEDWSGAVGGLTLLWYQDWREFLGRDFTVTGNDPEHNPNRLGESAR